LNLFLAVKSEIRCSIRYFHPLIMEQLYFCPVFETTISRAHEAHEDQHLDRASVTDDVTNEAEAPEQQVLEREPGGVLGGQPLSRREDEGGDRRAVQLDRHERRR